CERPQFIYRVAPVKPEDAARREAGHGPIRFTLDPAPINVDCAGPIRENVPSHSLLGDGLTGEHNRLKRGLQSRTPAIPLRGLGGGGRGDVHDLLPAVLAVRKLTRAARRLFSVTGNLAPDHFPFC